MAINIIYNFNRQSKKAQRGRRLFRSRTPLEPLEPLEQRLGTRARKKTLYDDGITLLALKCLFLYIVVLLEVIEE